MSTTQTPADNERSEGSVHEFRAYCDICKTPSPWYPDGLERSREWRSCHFETEHTDNPMRKTNCRIQRRKSK